MKNWTQRAAEAAQSIIKDCFAFSGIEPARGDGESTSLSHAYWMAQELLKGEMTPTKACRWLGYLQAILIVRGLSNLDAEKHRNQLTGDRQLGEDYVQIATAKFLKERSYHTADVDLVCALTSAAADRGAAFDVRFRAGNYYLEIT